MTATSRAKGRKGRLVSEIRQVQGAIWEQYEFGLIRVPNVQDRTSLIRFVDDLTAAVDVGCDLSNRDLVLSLLFSDLRYGMKLIRDAIQTAKIHRAIDVSDVYDGNLKRNVVESCRKLSKIDGASDGIQFLIEHVLARDAKRPGGQGGAAAVSA
ncbi:MAG: hypothetical protein WEF50_11140 [Myxococcota bacterium]